MRHGGAGPEGQARDATREAGRATVANPKVAEKGATLKKNIDKVLDEIDGILEENAEEFVKSYVQRGGE